jgi:hypothetical protein
MKVKYNSFRKYLVLVFSVIFPLGILHGQETLDTQDELITNIFNYGILINSQTTETTSKGSFELRIEHRFGELDLKDFGNTIVQEFLGFDGSANIRFGFTFAVSDRFQIGIGRTKIDKTYDFEGKYRLFRQKETGTPISVTLYFNTAISTKDFPEVGPNEFFADFETPFEHKFAHRVSYSTQFLVSKKIGENLSLELNPTFIYKNLVPAGDKNLTIATSLGARFKTGITSSIIFEYAAKFNNRNDNYKNPISLGYEIGTVGHAFQIIISSTNQIIEQNIYTTLPLDYTDGKFLIGFNIKRTFWNGKK